MKTTSNQNKVPVVQTAGISNVIRNNLLVLLGLSCCAGFDSAIAQSVILSPTTPTVGDGVQNLVGSSLSGNASVQYASSYYLSGDNNGVISQTFTTGGNSLGYTISAVSLHQVSYETAWNYGDGTGVVNLQIFQMLTPSLNGGTEVSPITVLGSESAVMGGSNPSIYSPTGPGTPQWLTFNLASPITLAPNTQYGFQMGSSGVFTGGFFMEVDGSSTDVYAGGSAAISGSAGVPDSSAIWTGGYNPGDRVFVASMNAIQPIPEPSTLALAGLGGLSLLMLARRQKC